MILDDYLGKAANEKRAAKTAIKEKRFDDAWRHLNNQKEYYLRHASRMGFSKTDTLVLDSSPHEDMANILRLEGKHENALSNISYTYKATYAANRPIITLEKKLEAYYNRAYKKQPFKRFLSLLKALPNSDYISVRDLVEIYFPLSPNDDEEESPKERNLSEQEIKRVNDNFLKQRSAARKKEHIGIPPPLSNSPIKSIMHSKANISYPEPKYPTKVAEPQTDSDSFLGYPISEWIIGVIVGVVLLIGFIWLLS
ncbi:hypothetical protein ACFZ8N_10345 [Acinetobacter baumannii]|uniref:hypothetical protein n=1 Tax=Acinetobacter baumannii TaxID=470 RepID=UPI00112C2F0D|nr:hypothetical protein [Acinetobacter baumannii]NAS36764.1 hypothetical protein [Acinetobacter baumannii]TPS45423.1 hypothetical protein FJU83_15265 [Acinetobacter baumannii]HAV3707902.1 hypothetical protein [Acinetobacter baumannii]